jgi:hypothetical protein
MRLVQKLCFVVLASSLTLAQTGTSSGTDTSQLQSDVRKLLDAMDSQQKAMAEQQKQIAEQQLEIERLKKQLAGSEIQPVSTSSDAQAGKVVNASLTTSGTNPAVRTVSDTAQGEKPKESPLSFRIGGTDFTPGGFVDFENVFRSTNTGNVAATSFGSIPFSNTVAGHLTEYRSTGQYSRFNIKVNGKYGENNVTGYVEFDFNGNDAANVFVTSNPHTDRLRLYWVDLKRGKWEFLGGQTWGLQTPNRLGVSPNPSDLSLGFHEDAGIGVGYNYTRAGEFRVAYHVNDDFVWAFAAQNPDQFTNGEVIFPAAFNAQLGGQLDAANITTTPNVGPDFLTKFAYDHDFGARHFHFEAGGMEHAVKTTVLAPSSTATSAFTNHTAVGGGFFGGTTIDLFRAPGGQNFRFVASGMWGDGVGRYLNGLAPDAVIRPINGSGTTCAIVGTVATGCDAKPSLVHSGDFVAGFEFQPHPKTQFGMYYGGAYAERNFGVDITSTAATQPFIGFGFPNSTVPLRGGSANNNNRAIQEGTIDWVQTFWRNPQYGAVQLYTQGSYLTRAPWFVAAGAPKNAHLFMTYVSLRYVLP